MRVALALATFASNVRTAPKSIRSATVRAVFDLVGSAIAGHGTVGAAAARADVVRASGARPGAGVHPGAAVIPGGIATAEAIGADAERVLTAIALGYEIGVRISAARDFRALHTVESGLLCGAGGA